MSLFKARDWWNTQVGQGEDFDIGCLVVGNISNVDSITAIERIAIGSYAGILRIYNPHLSKDGFIPEQLLIEQNLGAAILQVSCGKFVSAISGYSIAVLHPRRLSVYTLNSTAGAISHGAQYKLKHIYSHNLQRTSFNMCHGPFGQVQDKDFICVQSMDGTLSVFEQESFSFTRFLPDSLLPGPLAYVPSIDSFITVSSSRAVESYKYQVLAVAAESKTKEDAQNPSSGKRVTADWSMCIGEQAICIEVLTGASPSILILGERSVFCFTEQGKLKFMKKLEYSGRCMKVNRQSIDTVNYMIASHTNTLMIYKDCVLQWAAQLNHTPVQIDYCSMDSVPGGVVMLVETGHLGIHYLGTDPALMVMPSTQFRHTKYDEYASEIRKYQQIIREKSGKQAILPAKAPEDDVKLVITTPSQLDSPSRADDVEYKEDDVVPSITVQIDVHVRMSLSNVRVNIFLDSPLASDRTEYEFPSISANSPAVIRAPIFMKYNFLPSSLRIRVAATYLSSSGSPRVTQSHITLPLKLVVKPAPPVKSAMFKVTVDSNKPPVNLNDLFPELLGMNAGGPGAALGFQFYGGPVVTLLASKTSQRYRIQSDDFASMWLITKDLIDRLKSHFGPKSGLICSHSSSLPIQEFFESLDAHFEYRIHALKYKELLEQKALQFRAIQRRLLTRFKDKTPSPLAYLDNLLEGTFRQLLAIAEHAQDNQKTLKRAANNLSSAINLLNYLILLTYDLSEADFKVLQAILDPNVTDNGYQGWEEMVDTTITQQLRTNLAKSVKDQNVNIEMLHLGGDTSKLKKHIAIFIERISKGISLSSERPSGKSTKASDKVMDKRNIAEKDREASVLGASDTPIGSRMGQKTGGLRSNKDVRSPRRLSELNGSSDLELANQLPALQAGGKLKPLRKSQVEVPDLDELTNGDGM
ncbi:protein PTHB1-like [Watersipora subatra]|uniref:protein PTHB1-like n=1 Tax=Watersipora subatra TaxID=2589382 RepID=UPI00355C485A